MGVDGGASKNGNGAPVGSAEDEEERPTLVPKFNPEELAREAEAKERAAEAAGEEERPTVVPKFNPEDLAREAERNQRASQPASDEPAIDEARRLLAQGQAEQALLRLARVLEVLPQHAEANALSDQCRVALERECLAAVGSHSAILALAVAPAELQQYALDPLSGFLLSLVDGSTDVETVLDLSGRPRLLALQHLRSLVERGILRSGPSGR